MAFVQKLVFRPACEVLPLNSWSEIGVRLTWQYPNQYTSQYGNTQTYYYDFRLDKCRVSGDFPYASGGTISHNYTFTTETVTSPATLAPHKCRSALLNVFGETAIDLNDLIRVRAAPCVWSQGRPITKKGATAWIHPHDVGTPVEDYFWGPLQVEDDGVTSYWIGFKKDVLDGLEITVPATKLAGTNLEGPTMNLKTKRVDAEELDGVYVFNDYQNPYRVFFVDKATSSNP